MGHLAEPYQFVLSLIQDLESGLPVRSSVRRYTGEAHGEFADQLLVWSILQEQGKLVLFKKQKDKMNSFRRSIFDLLDFALQGVSVLEPLYLLEKELRAISEERLDTHLAQLPFKLMIPLMLFQFPALLILILGPLLLHLMSEVQ